jgi:hypothetical protein
LCDKDSEGSGELRLDTSLSVGEEEVEVPGCRSVVLISGSGCGGGAGAAAGAGISAFLAMAQVKAHASEIEAGLSLEAQCRKQNHDDGAYTHGTPATVENDNDDGVDEARRRRKHALPLPAVSLTAWLLVSTLP